MFILQVLEPALATRLGDQLFCIILLVVIATVLWKRQKSLEDKLTRYMSEDRTHMMRIIENNNELLGRLEEVLEGKQKEGGNHNHA